MCVCYSGVYVSCVFYTAPPLSSRSTRTRYRHETGHAHGARAETTPWPVHSGPTPQSPDSKAY